MSRISKEVTRTFRRLMRKAFPVFEQRREFWIWSREDQKRLDFYRQFVTSGDVVFDVGANLGNRAKIFHKLGANVIAIEPQTTCADYLQSVFDNKTNFQLVRVALGSSPGEAEMSICSTHQMSSLADNWLQAVKQSGRFGKERWVAMERVAIDTLDNLIAQFGRPSFVKVDVEGFEEQVLAGLSAPVSAISLEFTPEFMEGTLRCIDYLCAMGNPTFQLSMGESMELAGSEWVGAEKIKQMLSRVPSKSFGDLYARFDVLCVRQAAA